MSVHHYLYIPIDPDKRADMESTLHVDLSSVRVRSPNPKQLRADLDAIYESYDGKSWATDDGFEAHFTKRTREWQQGDQRVSEYDELNFDFSAKVLRDANLVFLGRHLPNAAHSLGAFLDLLDRHFGDWWIFETSGMCGLGRDQLMERYR